MTIRLSILTMLEEEPMYGLRLKNEFETRTGSVWPVNVGQVYTTLSRLERDGLVVAQEDSADGHRCYEITEAGRAEVRAWFAAPIGRAVPDRDELVIKLVLAFRRTDIEVADVVQTERKALVRILQDYTRLKADPPAAADIGWVLLLDSLILQIEAQLRWLDMCESRFARAHPLDRTGPAVGRKAVDREDTGDTEEVTR